MSTNPPAQQGPLCARCRQPLPAGTSFCVGCGFQNDAEAFAGRQLAIEKQLDDRYERASLLRKLFSVFGLMR